VRYCGSVDEEVEMSTMDPDRPPPEDEADGGDAAPELAPELAPEIAPELAPELAPEIETSED
jgi:hypothetical protein